MNEHTLALVLIQLTLIILCARIGGAIARRLGQTRSVGEIITGVLLGPSLFGQLMPEISGYIFSPATTGPVTVLSQIGLMLLMFQIGLEFDFSHLRERQNRRSAIAVSSAGIAGPFIIGLLLGHLSAQTLAPDVAPIPYSLFFATVLSITAVPILGRIMLEFRLTRTRTGVITITAAAINDVVGWLLLALVTALTSGTFSYHEFALRIAALAAFFAASWRLARPVLKWLIKRLSSDKEALPPNLLAITLATIFSLGILTSKIGIFALLGAFIAGVLLHDQPAFVAAWRKNISTFVTVFFLPIFFTYTGLRTDIGNLDSVMLWTWCLIIFVGATLGKLGFCYFAARLSGLSAMESATIGIMMNTRALMALIVLNIGYDLGVIPPDVFTMLVIMAILTTAITAPVLRYTLRGMGHQRP